MPFQSDPFFSHPGHQPTWRTRSGRRGDVRYADDLSAGGQSAVKEPAPCYQSGKFSFIFSFYFIVTFLSYLIHFSLHHWSYVSAGSSILCFCHGQEVGRDPASPLPEPRCGAEVPKVQPADVPGLLLGWWDHLRGGAHHRGQRTQRETGAEGGVLHWNHLWGDQEFDDSSLEEADSSGKSPNVLFLQFFELHFYKFFSAFFLCFILESFQERPNRPPLQRQTNASWTHPRVNSPQQLYGRGQGQGVRQEYIFTRQSLNNKQTWPVIPNFLPSLVLHWHCQKLPSKIWVDGCQQRQRQRNLKSEKPIY